MQIRRLILKEYSLYVMLLLILLCPLTTWSKEKILRVGVAPGEPFAIIHGDHYQGISIVIWEMLAKNMHIKYQFVPMSIHIDDDVKQLASGQVDVLIGPITPTTERIKLVDFTKPYYLNQIGVVVLIKNIPFFSTLSEILTGAFGWISILILLLFLGYIHVFWFFERRKGYMGVEQAYWPGIKTSFWIHTLGISFDQLPTYLHTRLFRFIWFLAFVVLLTALSASITSSLTVALSNNHVKYGNLSDFNEKKIVAVADTAPYDLGAAAGLNMVSAGTRTEAINLLLQGKVAGYAENFPIADYYMRKYQLSDKLTMANAIIAQKTFAIALPINSPLRHQINVQLSDIQASGQIKFLCESLLGQKAAKNCEI